AQPVLVNVLSMQCYTLLLCVVVSFLTFTSRRTLHSFPTRRSSDLHRTRDRRRARRGPRRRPHPALPRRLRDRAHPHRARRRRTRDRKSTRLNSSHLVISYAVFCVTKKFSA